MIIRFVTTMAWVWLVLLVIGWKGIKHNSLEALASFTAILAICWLLVRYL